MQRGRSRTAGHKDCTLLIKRRGHVCVWGGGGGGGLERELVTPHLSLGEREKKIVCRELVNAARHSI